MFLSQVCMSLLEGTGRQPVNKVGKRVAHRQIETESVQMQRFDPKRNSPHLMRGAKRIQKTRMYLLGR